jgi:site-specific DNA recombinase
MRAAIYARYSSDSQRAASIEDQVRLCRERSEREGWTLYRTYSDAAVSGASMLRPGIQALIADAREGRFDVVVAEALDRISRDQEDVAGFFKRLTHAGVAIVTLAEGEIGHLHIGLKGTMNALFLKDLADKTRRGLRGRVEDGKSGGGNSYGYDVVHSLAGDGSLVRGERRVKADEAAIVERIFRDYVGGKSPRAIAFALNEEGVAGPRGSGWGASTIHGNKHRGTGILNNELYVGQLVWNRLRYSKDPDTGKRLSRLNPTESWIIRDVPELRIIDQDLWDRAKQRQTEHSVATQDDDGQRLNRAHRPRTLLSGLLKCGSCGGSYSKISQDHFGCITARNKGTCKNRLNIRRDRLEAQILDGLGTKLMDPELFKVFAEEFHREVNRLRIEAGAHITAAKDELQQISRKTAKLVNAISEGAPAKALAAELQRLESREEELERLLAEQASPPPPLIHPAVADIYRRKVADLQSSLNDPELAREAFEIIRSLIEAIILTPEAGELQIELRGELASILALCSDSKKPAGFETERALQVSLVAGTGFEPVTFRL